MYEHTEGDESSLTLHHMSGNFHHPPYVQQGGRYQQCQFFS